MKIRKSKALWPTLIMLLFIILYLVLRPVLGDRGIRLFGIATLICLPLASYFAVKEFKERKDEN